MYTRQINNVIEKHETNETTTIDIMMLQGVLEHGEFCPGRAVQTPLQKGAGTFIFFFFKVFFDISPQNKKIGTFF